MTMGNHVLGPPRTVGAGHLAKIMIALVLALAGMLSVLQPDAGAQTPTPTAYGAEVVSFTPGRYTVDNATCVPNNTGGTGSAVLGAPDDPAGDGSIGATSASLSLGYGGSVTVRFSSFASGDDDPSSPDVWVWETGPASEPYSVEVSEDGESFVLVGNSNQAAPGSQGFDIDHAGFGRFAQVQYIRVTDTNGSGAGPCPDRGQINRDELYAVGSDIDAVGVITRALTTGLELEKTSNITDGAELEVGDVVEYTFTVTNTGNVDLTGVTVTDDLADLSAITPESQDIAARESATFTATYTVKQSDINNGKIVNSATATGQPDPRCTACTPPVSPPDENIIIIPPNPALTVVKTANTDGPVALGEPITYTFAVENTGNVTITDATITDELPDLTWVTGPNVGDLDPGDKATGTATYITTEADVLAGAVLNTATVTGNPPESCVDCDPTSPPSEETVTTEDPAPGIEVTKAADTAGPVALGDTITYTFTATNTGNVTLNPVVISDDLAGLQWGSGPNLGAVAPGQTATGTATYVVTEADLVNGRVVNTATGTGTPPERCDDCTPPSDTPPSVEVPTEDPVTGLAITKAADVTTPVAVGDPITYTFTATNTGTVTLDSVTITDALPGLTWVTGPNLGAAAPGQTLTGSATYVTTAADVANGVVANRATGTGTPRDCASCDTPVSPPVNVDVPTANPALSLLKTADTAGPVNAGDVITYTFTVTNTGNVAIEDVVLADALPGLSWTAGPELGTIAVDGTATGTATYTVTAGDVAAGRVLNSATATCATCGEGTPPSSVEVPTVAPGLTLVKTADTAGPVAVGDTITYTFTVTNTGNVALDGVTIADALPGLAWVSGPELGTIGVGGSATGTATYVATQADVNAGVVANRATATGTPTGGEPITSDPSEVTVPTITPTLGLTLDKTVSPNTTVEAGDTVTYTFVVTNIGTTTLEDVTVTDVLPGLSAIAGPQGSALEPGQQATFTATYVVTEADAILGVLSNTATVSGTGPGGEPVSAIDSARVRACTVPQPETPEPTEAAGTPEATEEVAGTPEPTETEVPTETEAPVETEEVVPTETEEVLPTETEAPVETEEVVPTETEEVLPTGTEEGLEPDEAPQGFVGARATGSRVLLQEAPAEEALADCVPLAPEPETPVPAPQQPQQPAPAPQRPGGGGAVSGGGGGAAVTALPKTGQTGAATSQATLLVGGLALLAAGAIGLGLISRGTIRFRKS